MSQSSVVKKGSKLDQIANSYKELTGETIEVGHFQRQGKHYSGLTYPQLLKFWMTGVTPDGKSVPIKNVKAQFNYMIQRSGFSRQFMMELKDWNKTSHLKKNTVNKLLILLGRAAKEDYKDLFGMRSFPFMPQTTSDDHSTPLYETGDLADNTAYRTSKGRRVTK
jgi:hypothetical protein